MSTRRYEGWPTEASVLEVDEGDILEFSISVDNRTSKPVSYRALVGGDLASFAEIAPLTLSLGLGGSGSIKVRLSPPPGLHEAVLEVFRGNDHHEGGEPRSITVKCNATARGGDLLPQPGDSGGGSHFRGDRPGVTPQDSAESTVKPISTTGSGAVGFGVPGEPTGYHPTTPVNPGSEQVTQPPGAQPKESPVSGSPASSTPPSTTAGGQTSGISQSGSLGMSSAPRQLNQTTVGSERTAGESKPVGVDPFKQEQEELQRKWEEERKRREAQRRRPEQFEADLTVDDPPREGGSVTLRPGQKAKVLIPVSFDLEEAPNRNATREFGLTVTNPLALLNQDAVKVEWGSESIPAGESALLFFLLNVPTNTPQGRYDFVISVTSGQRSSEDRQMTLVVEPVAAVQVVAEKTEVLQRFLPPRSCTFDLTVKNHALGNTPTAYRLAVKRPEDNAAAQIPYDDADLYETPDWEILFDDELNDIRRQDSSTKLIGNYHKLAVRRKGIWWFGFQEKLALKVEAVPVTESGNSDLPGNSLDLLLTRQRLVPLSSWLAVPLLTLLLLILMMASSSPELNIKNGFNPPGSDIYYVFADQLQSKQEQEITVQFEVKNGGWFRHEIKRITPGGTQPISGRTEDKLVLQGSNHDAEAFYEVKPWFGQSSKRQVVFLGYRTSNQFSFDPPKSDRQPSDLQIKQSEALRPTGVYSVEPTTGLEIEEWTLDFDVLADYPEENGKETKVFRLYNLATRKTAYKIAVAYHLDEGYQIGQGDTDGQGRFDLVVRTEDNIGEQLTITDTKPDSNQEAVLWLMTSDGSTLGKSSSSGDQSAVRIYRIVITRGGGQ